MLNYSCPAAVKIWAHLDSFHSYVRQSRSPFKMAAITKNRNFFNCPLLLYYKSKWAQILTAATWQGVV
jgi:hypothetical protein